MKRKIIRIVCFFIFISIIATMHNVDAQEIGQSWEFNEDGNFEGILLGMAFRDSVVENGYLKATVRTLFPSLKSGPFELEAKNYGFIQLRMKLPGATSGKIMWLNDAGNVGYYRFSVCGDSLFHRYEIPVYLSDQWTGKITQIVKLDFNPIFGSTVEIDYIRIVRIGPKPTISKLVPIRTILKPNEKIPLMAIVQNKGDVKDHFQSLLLVPEGVTLVQGARENDHGVLFKDVTDTVHWVILFPDTGDFPISLKLFSKRDTIEKTIAFHVTNTFWNPKEFLLSAWSPPYAWYGPPFEDSVFANYKNANFNQMLWVRDDQALMEKVHAYGFKYFLLVTPVFGDLYLRGKDRVAPPEITETMLQKLDTLIEKYRDDPDLLGYHICDEPYRTAFPNIAKVVARIRQRDPTRLSFVNIWPNVAEDKGSGKYIDALLQTTKLELLSYDRYPFFNGYDETMAYFNNLELVRGYALKYKIPFCNIIQAIGTNGTSRADLNWRTPSEAEHRFLAYSSLAYGVHGIIWFHWHLDWGVTGSPDREQIYTSLQKLNKEIQALGKIMLHLTTTGVYRSKPYGKDLNLPANGIIQSASPKINLVIGYFQNNEGQKYFMLMNTNYSASSTFQITLNGTTDRLLYFNVHSESWQNVAHSDSTGNSVFTVELRPGGGKLFSVGALTGVPVGARSPGLPRTLELRQNYPNPFNPNTTIAYSIPVNGGAMAKPAAKVTLKIYDVRGQEVATLVHTKQSSGTYRIEWNGRNQNGMQVSSGVYIYKLTVDLLSRTRKMILLR